MRSEWGIGRCIWIRRMICWRQSTSITSMAMKTASGTTRIRRRRFLCARDWPFRRKRFAPSLMSDRGPLVGRKVPWPRSGSISMGGTLKTAMVFVLDNYDSFTYNLVQYMGELGAEMVIRRNDELSVDEVEGLGPERILLSPGPGTPQEAGISIDLIRRMAGKVPILGVCLGHQAIGAAFGGDVVRAKKLMHGKTSEVEHDGKMVFAGIASPMTCTRYHSLIVSEKNLPGDLEISARTADGTIMGL